MSGYLWPPADHIAIRDDEPFVAGTDFRVREVHGFSVNHDADTVTWLLEAYRDVLTTEQAWAAVRYYNAHEFLLRFWDEGQE